MAAKRGKGRGKGRKGHRKHGGSSKQLKLLTSMNKKLTRIEHKVNPERHARIMGKKRARLTEAELAAKYS